MLDDFYQEEINRETAKVLIGGNGDYIVVKSTKDKAYSQALSRRQKQFKARLTSKSVKDHEVYEILSPVIAKYLLVDWKVSISPERAEKDFPDMKLKKDKDGRSLIPFTVKNAEQVLGTKGYEKFADFIVDTAREKENFIDDEVADDEKN